MLTSDDRKEVDLHLQRGSIACGVFRDILELVIFKICHSMMYWGGGGCLNRHAKALKQYQKVTCKISNTLIIFPILLLIYLLNSV